MENRNSKYWILYVGMIISIFYGCKESKSNLEDIKPLKENKEFQKFKNLSKFDDYFSFTNVINLKTPDSVLIGYIDKLFVTEEGEIITQDRVVGHNVMLFNNKGEFIRTIGSRGQGPEEFMTPLYVAVKGSIITIYDNTLQRVISYSKDGKFLQSWRVKHQYSGIIYIENKIAMRRTPFSEDGNENVIDLYSDNGDLASTIKLPVSIHHNKLKHLPRLNFGFISNGHELFYMYPEV